MASILALYDILGPTEPFNQIVLSTLKLAICDRVPARLVKPTRGLCCELRAACTRGAGFRRNSSSPWADLGKTQA